VHLNSLIPTCPPLIGVGTSTTHGQVAQHESRRSAALHGLRFGIRHARDERTTDSPMTAWLEPPPRIREDRLERILHLLLRVATSARQSILRPLTVVNTRSPRST